MEIIPDGHKTTLKKTVAAIILDTILVFITVIYLVSIWCFDDDYEYRALRDDLKKIIDMADYDDDNYYDDDDYYDDYDYDDDYYKDMAKADELAQQIATSISDYESQDNASGIWQDFTITWSSSGVTCSVGSAPTGGQSLEDILNSNIVSSTKSKETNAYASARVTYNYGVGVVGEYDISVTLGNATVKY